MYPKGWDLLPLPIPLPIPLSKGSRWNASTRSHSRGGAGTLPPNRSDEHASLQRTSQAVGGCKRGKVILRSNGNVSFGEIHRRRENTLLISIPRKERKYLTIWLCPLKEAYSRGVCSKIRNLPQLHLSNSRGRRGFLLLEDGSLWPSLDGQLSIWDLHISRLSLASKGLTH